jgi:hypothetical protein
VTRSRVLPALFAMSCGGLACAAWMRGGGGMMRAWVRALPAAGAATIAATVMVSCGASPPAPHRPGSRGGGNHVVTAAERGSGRSGSLTVTDPYAAGSKLRRTEYHLRDGYTKRVLIPGGAYVAAEDIAICGQAGQRYPDNGFAGTGLPCTPVLHVVEVFYHQRAGDLAGRYRPHRNVEVTEIARGRGRYLTVGHIDHGALLAVEYYWANGEHLTVRLRGDVLIDHIRLLTTAGRLGAAVTRHG